jgi:hypothetical protein
MKGRGPASGVLIGRLPPALVLTTGDTDARQRTTARPRPRRHPTGGTEGTRQRRSWSLLQFALTEAEVSATDGVETPAAARIDGVQGVQIPRPQSPAHRLQAQTLLLTGITEAA